MRLEIISLSKSFAAPVLRSIDLTLRAGEIRGLVGENGAGKSTLLNILAGQHTADAGTIAIDGAAFTPGSVRGAMARGVALATQELSVIDTLSVTDNLTLPELSSRFGFVSTGRQAKRTAAMLGRLGMGHVAREAPVSALSLAEKQLIEFGRAALRRPRLLLLDEPTAALSREQAERLHDIVREIAADGTAILYVSHRLEDVRRICLSVSVMRDGQLVSTRPARDFSAAEMIADMTGKTHRAAVKHSVRSSVSPIVLKVEALKTDALSDPITLDLRRGEIVGLAGLAGAGRSEVLRALMGLDTHTAGQVLRATDAGFVPIRSATQAVTRGMGYVPEDRKDTGIFAGQDVDFNLSLSSLVGVRRRDAGARGYADAVRTLGIRCSGPSQPIERLSGGNQQKVILGRWLVRDTPVLLLDEPGRGVDVAAKAEIFAELHRLAAGGTAILMASSELEELIEHCDRVIVLSKRRVAAVLPAEGLSEAAILEAAYSGHQQREAPPETACPESI